MYNDEPDCDICGRDMNDINATRERCIQCGRTGCDHCVKKYYDEHGEEWDMCDDCAFD